MQIKKEKKSIKKKGLTLETQQFILDLCVISDTEFEINISIKHYGLTCNYNI